MMKLQVGDYIRIRNTKLEAFGAYGYIASIDYEWIYPYEVKFDDGVEYSQELYGYGDLVLVAGGYIDKSKKLPHSYIDIKFQDGVVSGGVNGVQMEDVIDLLIDRLEGFQKGNYPCRENALAITKLEEARMWLNERTRKRKEQDVEGKYSNHDGGNK